MDKRTDGHTYEPSTVTLAVHARGGLKSTTMDIYILTKNTGHD